MCYALLESLRILDVRHDHRVQCISQVLCRYALYLGDRYSMTHICARNIEHRSL